MRKEIADLRDYVTGRREWMSQDLSKDQWLAPISYQARLANGAPLYAHRDANGIPMVAYRSVGLQYNPSMVANCALAYWNDMRLNGVRRPDEFIRLARWFLEAEGGAYFYEFDWLGLRRPWLSAMAQGQAISVLVRAHIQTGEPEFLCQARLALEPLLQSVQDGGLSSRLSDGSFFLEEYPLAVPDHVLNGFIVALFGVIDLDRVQPSPSTRQLIDPSLETLSRHLHRWDLGGWSAYDLHNETSGPRNYVTQGYQSLHVALLEALYQYRPNEVFQVMAQRWNVALRSPGMRLRGLIGKTRYRLAHPPQR